VHLEAPIYGIPSHIENWATALAAIGALGSLLYCIRASLGRRSLLPIYLFVGGALTCFIEPFIDTMGHAIFAQEDRIPWTSSFGRHIPAYIGLILMFYVAPAYLALLGVFDKGVTTRRFLLLCGSATIVFEVVPMHYDLWRYYGPQGVQFGQVPLWWGFLNAHGLIGTAVALFFLQRVLPGRALALLVPLMPVVFVAIHTAGAIPGYLAINSASSETAAYLGTLAACVLCSVWFWLYSKVVCVDAPAETKVDVLARATP
jgi:hypothetical protein